MNALVARGYRVINVDARGHGDSDWSRDGRYSLNDGAADLRTIVSNVRRPFALVGASLGGATAIHAIALGLDPAALVLVDIVPSPEPAGIKRIVQFMQDTSGGFDTIDEAVEAVAAYNPHRKRPRNHDGLRRNLRTHADGRLHWHWDPWIVATDPKLHHDIVERSARALMHRKDLPILLVRGLSSDVVSDTSIEAFRAIIPWLEVADVSGAGHMVSGDRNDAFNDKVIAFLERTLDPAASSQAT